MSVNYELHTEQILQKINNKNVCPSGLSIEINHKKIGESMWATPLLIYVSDYALFVGNNQKNTLENTL